MKNPLIYILKKLGAIKQEPEDTPENTSENTPESPCIEQREVIIKKPSTCKPMSEKEYRELYSNSWGNGSQILQLPYLNNGGVNTFKEEDAAAPLKFLLRGLRLYPEDFEIQFKAKLLYKLSPSLKTDIDSFENTPRYLMPHGGLEEGDQVYSNPYKFKLPTGTEHQNFGDTKGSGGFLYEIPVGIIHKEQEEEVLEVSKLLEEFSENRDKYPRKVLNALHDRVLKGGGSEDLYFNSNSGYVVGNYGGEKEEVLARCIREASWVDDVGLKTLSKLNLLGFKIDGVEITIRHKSTKTSHVLIREKGGRPWSSPEEWITPSILNTLLVTNIFLVLKKNASRDRQLYSTILDTLWKTIADGEAREELTGSKKRKLIHKFKIDKPVHLIALGIYNKAHEESESDMWEVIEDCIEEFSFQIETQRAFLEIEKDQLLEKKRVDRLVRKIQEEELSNIYSKYSGES